jgi:hypothetical protein
MDIDLRKLAADTIGRAALAERGSVVERPLSGVDAIALDKIAGADVELLKIAESISPNDVLKVYESLGGSYTAPVKE